MKELSVEEKAKAYDEAIERAKNTIKVNQTIPDIVECVESLFPELKESGDEKIRKCLLSHFSRYQEDEIFLNDITMKQILAWLEKQGEQKRQMPLVKSVSTDFKNRLGTLMHYTSVDLEKEENKQLLNEAAKELLQLAYSDKANEIALASAKTWEESMAILIAANNAYRRGQKEHKPIDKVEPKFKIGQIIKKEGFNIGFTIAKIEDDFYYNDEGDYFPFTDQDNWELVEQNPWSEEGEYYRNIILYILNNECVGKTDKENAINWLKSLRPQSQWKPSKKQLEALEHSLGDYNIKIFEDRYKILKSLYNELKKLKG